MSCASASLKGLKKNKASGREKAIGAAAKALGGKIDAIWYSLGDHDIIGVLDLPSHVHIAALCSNVGASGLVSTSTTTLLTVAEMDQALAEKVTYRAPGT
jgi:uncharacterized protein with GYD domain